MKNKEFHNPEDFIGELLKRFVETDKTSGYTNDRKDCGCKKEKLDKDDKKKEDKCCEFDWCFKQEVCCLYTEFLEAAKCALKEWCSYCDEQKKDEQKDDGKGSKNECCKFDFGRKQDWCCKYKEYLRVSRCALKDWCCKNSSKKDEHEDGCCFSCRQKSEICCKYEEFLEVLECAFKEWCECFGEKKKDDKGRDKCCKLEWRKKCKWCSEYEEYLKALKCALEDWCCRFDEPYCDDNCKDNCCFDWCRRAEICCKFDEFIQVVECALKDWCCDDSTQKEDKCCKFSPCEKREWCCKYEEFLRAAKCAMKDWCQKDCDCCKWPRDTD